MRISDWSSDVCSSDLLLAGGVEVRVKAFGVAMPNLDLGPRNRLAISSKHRIVHDKRMAILVGAIVEPGQFLFHWRAHYIQRTVDGERSLDFDATSLVFRIHAPVKETTKTQARSRQA